MHSLHNLQQQIWDERAGGRNRYLLCSTVRDRRWELALWTTTTHSTSTTNSEGSCSVWTGEGDATRADEIADAIATGMLHVQERPNGGFKVFIDVKPAIVVYVGDDEAINRVPDLVDTSLAVLSRPKMDQNSQEIRRLEKLLADKEAEIDTLHAKLLSTRGALSRHQALGPKRDGPSSSQKLPPPAALNRLQPNAKRRKIVEEEFAGSDSEEEEDDDNDDDDDDEEEEEGDKGDAEKRKGAAGGSDDKHDDEDDEEEDYDE